MADTTMGDPPRPRTTDGYATNEMVLEIWRKKKSVPGDACRAVLEVCGKEEEDVKPQSLKSNLAALLLHERQLKKHPKTRPELLCWLNEPYKLPGTRPVKISQKTQNRTCDCLNLQAVNLKLAKEVSDMQARLKAVEYENLQLMETVSKQTRMRNLRQEKIQTKKAAIAKKNKSRTIALSHLSQDVSRKKVIIESLRAERRQLKSELQKRDWVITKLQSKVAESVKHQAEVKKLKRSRQRLSSSLLKLKGRIPSEKKVLQRENLQLLKTVDCLTAEIEETLSEKQEEEVLVVKANAKTYGPALRHTIFKCLANQVPIESVSHVIDFIITKLTSYSIPQLPDKTTISQMAYEMGVLSDLRVGEILATEQNITLAWDATSLDGCHINEVHITTPSVSLALQIDTIAGGKTEDYVQHITECISDVTTTYASFLGKDEHVMLREVHQHFKNTLTDRVAVNHCVVERLSSLFDSQLLELKCNLHPLDGLATAARQTLRKVDRQFEIQSSTYGSDCRVVNFIYGLTKMRYKQGKGDPQGFKLFLREEGIQSGMIVRYVGNRLHVLFHLAGVFHSMRKPLLDFLERRCTTVKSLREALIKDYKHPIIMVQLQALGLLGKVLTGPWMRMFYTNEDNKGHLDMVPHMKRCMTSLQRYRDDPLRLLATKKDVFGQNIVEDTVFTSLHAPLDNTDQEMKMTDIIQQLVGACIVLLERQLHRYLSGDLSKPSRLLKQQTKSASIHNIFAEQTLGMTDAQSRRAPNATIGFIDGKVRFIKNHIMEWLSEMPEVEQERKTNFAIHRARKVRELRNVRARQTDAMISARAQERIQKRYDTDRNALQRRIKMALGESYENVQAIFDKTEVELQPTLINIISDPASLLDKYIDHVWSVDGVDVPYHGHIIKIKTTQTKGTVVTVSYWLFSEKETDSIDEKIPVVQIIADYIRGGLLFDV